MMHLLSWHPVFSVLPDPTRHIPYNHLTLPASGILILQNGMLHFFSIMISAYRFLQVAFPTTGNHFHAVLKTAARK